MHSSYILYTQLKPYDIPQIIELEKQYTTKPWTEQQFNNALLQKKYYLFGIQEPSQKLLGYIFFYCNLDLLEIYTIAVQKHMQRKGYGKQLLNIALQQGVKQGIVRAILEVRATNESAIAFYKHFGFIHIGTRHNYYSDTQEDALIYSKEFTQAFCTNPSMEFS